MTQLFLSCFCFFFLSVKLNWHIDNRGLEGCVQGSFLQCLQFLLMFFFMYNIIMKFFPQPWDFQLDFCDYPCGKDIYDNALSNVWKVFQEKTEKNGTLAKKNSAYGRQRVSQPMQIEALIFFVEEKIYINPERLLVFKALRVGPQMHQSTSRTPPTRGPSQSAIWNNSLFLRLLKSVDECTSPLVKHLPRVDDPCKQSRTTPCF